jgi:hypothetical protein
VVYESLPQTKTKLRSVPVKWRMPLSLAYWNEAVTIHSKKKPLSFGKYQQGSLGKSLFVGLVPFQQKIPFQCFVLL